tara:strand:+ start:269 stop:490 length:222 start_codon:yes stop_codon:yes gene_type:complete
MPDTLVYIPETGVTKGFVTYADAQWYVDWLNTPSVSLTGKVGRQYTARIVETPSMVQAMALHRLYHPDRTPLR